jgi:hypothetical protein
MLPGTCRHCGATKEFKASDESMDNIGGWNSIALSGNYSDIYLERKGRIRRMEQARTMRKKANEAAS